MKNNNNNTPKRSLRIVSWQGKYRLLWVEEDDDGDVEYVLPEDDIDLKERCVMDLKRIMKKIAAAIDKPVIVVNAANKDIYFKER